MLILLFDFFFNDYFRFPLETKVVIYRSLIELINYENKFNKIEKYKN